MRKKSPKWGLKIIKIKNWCQKWNLLPKFSGKSCIAHISSSKFNFFAVFVKNRQKLTQNRDFYRFFSSALDWFFDFSPWANKKSWFRRVPEGVQVNILYMRYYKHVCQRVQISTREECHPYVTLNGSILILEKSAKTKKEKKYVDESFLLWCF